MSSQEVAEVGWERGADVVRRGPVGVGKDQSIAVQQLSLRAAFGPALEVEIQDGFGNRLEILPLDIRELVGQLLTAATSAGSRLDGKWALDVAGSAPPDELLNMLRRAFESRSQWLKNAAYGQVARLAALPRRHRRLDPGIASNHGYPRDTAP